MIIHRCINIKNFDIKITKEGSNMAYQKVVLTEKDTSVKKSPAVTDVSTSALKKFDTSYNDKLNELYTEFDKISTTDDIDTDVSTDTITKTNAIVRAKDKISFELKAFIVCAVMVFCALFGLTIYNVFVINELNSSIELVSEEVASTNANINQIIEDLYTTGKYANNGNKWAKEITGNGKIAAVVEFVENKAVDAPTNWFDVLCNFFSKILRS